MTGHESWMLPRIFLGAVFVSAGIYRVFYFGDARAEMAAFGLPWFFAVFVILVELCGGFMLIADMKPVWASLALGFMILFGLAAALPSWSLLIGSWRELFVFRATPLSILLHVTFLVMLAGIAMRKARG